MSLQIRNVELDDHQKSIDVMPNWWGGRDLTSGMSKIFFMHFQNSSFFTIKKGKILGFLIGFMSQSKKEEAYIHLAGVDPQFRKQGVGKALYHQFFGVCKQLSVSVVMSCTTPTNILSINFHQHMGFTILRGDFVKDGYEVAKDYLDRDNHKVLFKLII